MTKSWSAPLNCPRTTEDAILNHVMKPVDKSSINTLPLIETKFILVHFADLTTHKFYLFLTSPTELKTVLDAQTAAEMLQQAITRSSAKDSQQYRDFLSQNHYTRAHGHLRAGTTWQPIVQARALACIISSWTLGSQALPSSQKWVEDPPLTDVLVQAQPVSH